VNYPFKPSKNPIQSVAPLTQIVSPCSGPEVCSWKDSEKKKRCVTGPEENSVPPQSSNVPREGGAFR